MALGSRIIRLKTTTSTMDEIDALAAAGAAEGTVVLADEQRAGRGRAGRAWRAPAGTSVLCSVLLRPPVEPRRLSTLPLLVGVAVAEAIEEAAGVRCGLKWPNDVWIGGRKVAGVLLSSRAGATGIEYVNAGVGINVNVEPAALPKGATSLLVATDRPHDRDEVLRSLLGRLDVAYRAFRDVGGRWDPAPWRARAELVGRFVTVVRGGEEVGGVMKGVDEDGALLLEVSGGSILRIAGGDVVRGPRPADEAAGL